MMNLSHEISQKLVDSGILASDTGTVTTSTLFVM